MHAWEAIQKAVDYMTKICRMKSVRSSWLKEPCGAFDILKGLFYFGCFP